MGSLLLGIYLSILRLDKLENYMSKSEWGNITWKFFHTFAECIEDDIFPKIKNTAIDIIISICIKI